LRGQQNKNGVLTSRGLEIQRTVKKLHKQLAVGWSGARLPTTAAPTTKPSMFLRKSMLLGAKKVSVSTSRPTTVSSRGRGLRTLQSMETSAVREMGRGTTMRGRGRPNLAKNNSEREHAARRDAYRSRSRK